jgi:tetratricopeptide (TPR) repeat protein
VPLLRAAQARHPHDFWLNLELGRALGEAKEWDEAVGYCRAALALRPQTTVAHLQLGFALWSTGRLEGAARFFEEALRLAPESAPAHVNFGAALYARGQVEQAVRHYEEAVRLNPRYALAHVGLGNALSDRGRLDEAVGQYEQALRIDPKLAAAHVNVGNALARKGRPGEAVGCYEEAIRLDPKLALAHSGLGLARLAQGRFEEARDALRRCLELLPPRHPLRATMTPELQRCEHLLALNARLPAVLQGTDRPSGAAEYLEFVRFCQSAKRYAAAARLYADALAADPNLADDLKSGHRYDAACYAALAAAGQCTDAPKPDDKERARLRVRALGWLRADRALWQKRADSGQAESRATAQRALRHWQQDADLAGVRDKAALAALPAEERAEWDKLWADVAALLRRLDAAKPAAAPPGK